MEAYSSPSKVKSPIKLSQISPTKRRQYTVVKQGEFAVELWWVPPSHVRQLDVKSLRTTTLLGEIVGVFDCAYEEDDMSEVERLQSVTYEVEVVLKDSVYMSFFGFRKQEKCGLKCQQSRCGNHQWAQNWRQHTSSTSLQNKVTGGCL